MSADFEPRRLNMEKVDREESERTIKIMKPEDKACFNNALMAQSRLHRDAMYVEGWACLDIAPILTCHGWLETPDGRIIECTRLAYRAYYPVRKWSGTDAIRAALRKKQTPIMNFEFMQGKDGAKIIATHDEAYKDECGIDWGRLRTQFEEMRKEAEREHHAK